jgi:uncharacterized membrane protein
MLHEISLFVFIGCILVYAILLIISYARNKPSERNAFKLIYKTWVDQRIDGDPLVAIQSLRNVIMGASTFISGLLILLGLIIGFFSTFMTETTSFLGIPGLNLGVVQISTNIIVIIFSLYHFILSIRLNVRVTLLITAAPKKFIMGNIEGIKLTKKAFISAQNHWMFGLRGLFYLIATLIWFINSLLFILFSIIVTIYLILFQDIWVLTEKMT